VKEVKVNNQINTITKKSSEKLVFTNQTFYGGKRREK